jgi:hypothetical protein
MKNPAEAGLIINYVALYIKLPTKYPLTISDAVNIVTLVPCFHKSATVELLVTKATA